MRLIIIFFFMIILSFDAIADACDYKIEILADGDEFDSQGFKWRMRATKIEGKSTNITGTAKVESDGNTVKSYKPWTSDPIAKQKTSSEYSPNLKPGVYEITAEISVECDDTNKDNNIEKKEITIKGDGEAKKEEPKPAKKSEGKDEEQTSLQSAAPKIDTAPEPKNRQPASNPKKPAEEFDNVVELNSKNNKKPETTITANAIQNPENSEIVYESSSERAKGLIMVFLLTLSILLNIVLIWKR
jgi:hypothetical protein